jgi:hypothetical protein
MCLAGQVCAAPGGVCGGCVAAGIVRGQRGLGEECASDDVCGSGECLEDAGRMYCTRDCSADADCPDGYHCREERCVAGPRGQLGDRCVENGDCAQGLFCASLRDSSWCTRQCFDDNPCLEGFDCVAAGGTNICAPALGLVGDDCESDADCVTELCATDGPGAGACTRLCGADAACAPGYECRLGDDGTTATCVAPGVSTAGGGCSVSAGPRRGDRASLLSSALVAVLGLLIVGVRRRRRAR